MKQQMKFYGIGGIAAVGLFLSSCESDSGKASTEKPSTDKGEHEEFLARADEASGLLMKRLGTQLKSALKAGGPESALQVCQQVGQPLTDATNQELGGVTVTRTALKVRNPKNEPNESDRKVMEAWLQKNEDGSMLLKSEVVQGPKGGTVVYKPILTQQVCLKCHGDPATFSPELKASLNQLYPNDQATGFTEGSLRGVFKITFPPNKPTK